jgi:hypothetical protein
MAVHYDVYCMLPITKAVHCVHLKQKKIGHFL